MSDRAELHVFGLSHKSAPIELREQVALLPTQISPFLGSVRAIEGVSEALVVSTCNRTDLFVVAQPGREAEIVALLVARAREREAVEKRLYRLRGTAALRHLFRLAASLDSMVVGESQILGQVKQAYEEATVAGAIGPWLRRIVPRSFLVAKRVRSETDVAAESASVASVAVDLAGQIFGQLEQRPVLLVGAGKMATLSARHFRAAKVGPLTVVSRRYEHATEVAQQLAGQALPWEELENALVEADIVLCSTASPEPVLRKEMIEAAMRKRRGRWLFLIDIAVPRDVASDVSEVENVYLYDIDGLSTVVEKNLEKRGRAAEKGETLIEEEIERFMSQEKALDVVPTLRAFRAHVLRVAEDEARRTVERLPELSQRGQEEVHHLAQSIAKKLLHAPSVHLKRHAAAGRGAEWSERLLDLFDLDPVDGPLAVQSDDALENSDEAQATSAPYPKSGAQEK